MAGRRVDRRPGVRAPNAGSPDAAHPRMGIRPPPHTTRPTNAPRPQIDAHDKQLVEERLRERERAAQERAAQERAAPGRGGSVYDVRAGIYHPRATVRRPRRWATTLVALAVIAVIGYFAVPPLAGGFLRALAEANPDLLHFSIVADAVGDVMDGRPDTPAGTDSTPVEFVIPVGASSGEITDQLVARDLVTDRLAFTWVLAEEGGLGRLQAGTHVLNRTMTPRQVADTLQGAPTALTATVDVALRQGLRLEQIVAYLETLPLDNLDPEQFYGLASDPPDSLRARFDWLSVIPPGKSLEGFLGSGIFEVPADIDAEGMIETLLQRWHDSPSFALIAEAQQRGLDFYSIDTLGSIVEREASLDSERPLIAGVFQNRLEGKGGTQLLGSDAVIIYVKDTLALRDLYISQWPQYEFWTLDGLGSPSNFEVPPDLAGYQVYHSRGLPPTPICTPGLASLQAALNPDTSEGYLYFLGKNDGSHEHVFARTYAEHLHNIEVYLGGGSPSPSAPSTSESPSASLP
jgi:UPF0755 protein